MFKMFKRKPRTERDRAGREEPGSNDESRLLGQGGAAIGGGRLTPRPGEVNSAQKAQGAFRAGGIAGDLGRILRDSQVVDAPGELTTFAYDASFETQLEPRTPEAAVIAGSEDDVQLVLEYAHERGIPVTARGAASGQAAGAVAYSGGIILSLNAMNRVIEVDEPNLQAICEPGVVHAQLNGELKPRGLVFPPDPGSSKMATVGGMASTNAAGMRALKYGATSAWVLGMNVVLADGRMIQTGSVGSRAKQSSAGLDLTKLLVGSEGTLGVVTRLRLKLMPIPPARAIVTALFDDLENAGRAVQEVTAAGISPSAIEILDERCMQAINLYRPGMELPDARAMLLFEVDGNEVGVRADAEKIAEAVQPFARGIEWSDEPERIATLWEARSLVGAAIGVLRPGSNRAYCGEDICVPVFRIPETLREIQEISQRHRIPIATYGHIGGGNLHPGHLIDVQDPDEIKRVLRVADEIHDLALTMGGTVTGEHGVGASRAAYMEREHGQALGAMREVKSALDPRGILNPGKLSLSGEPAPDATQETPSPPGEDLSDGPRQFPAPDLERPSRGPRHEEPPLE